MYSTTDDINQKRLYNVIAFKMSIYLVCHLANLHLPSFSREKKSELFILHVMHMKYCVMS